MKNAWSCIVIGIAVAIIDAFIKTGTILWVMYIPLFFISFYRIYLEIKQQK